MVPSATSDQQITWEITEDLIDADRLARACTKVQIRIKNHKARERNRKLWIIGTIVLVVDVIFGVLFSLWIIYFLALYFLIAFVGVHLWNRRAAKLSARHLREYPHTFSPGLATASPEGLYSSGAEGESRLTWRSFDSVWRQDDLIVLARSPMLLLPLPDAALVSDLKAEDALKLLGWWIAAAHAAEERAPAQ